MALLTKSEKHNPNYLAKVIIVKNLRKHANADRLNVFTVDGNNIITSNATPEGQVSIYFPLESQLAHEYLSKNNDYRKTSGLNADPESAGGFFEDKRRVKAVKLRGEKSEGYVVPIATLEPLIGSKFKELENYIGEEFDTVDGILLLNKYIAPRQMQSTGQGEPKQRNKYKKVSKLIENQFRLHYDTSQLGKNLHKVTPDSIISLTWKLHGTSWVSSRVLVKRQLKWYEKLAKWLGVNVREEEYGNLYSSRKVIKNENINKTANHYYKYDLWSDINDQFKDQLLDGETLYGEAVGYTKDGGWIQNGFDYGCKYGESKLYVYRITHTSAAGKVIDLPFNMVQERCEQLGVEAVPLIFFGKAKNFHSPTRTLKTIGEDSVSNQNVELNNEDWRESLLTYLKANYVYDQDSQFCNNKVPEEGIVLRVEGLKPEALKLKAFRFLEGESKALDKGEVNMEDEQNESSTEA